MVVKQKIWMETNKMVSERLFPCVDIQLIRMTGNDETIYPVDFKSAGHIVDDDMHRIM